MLILVLSAFAQDCPPGTARSLAGNCEALPPLLEDGGCKAAPKAGEPDCTPRPAEAEVFGTLDRAELAETIKGAMPSVRACRVDSSLTGRVTVRFSVSPDGRVASSGVESSTLRDPKVGACVAAEIGKLTFPKPSGGGGVMVTFPFDFR